MTERFVGLDDVDLVYQQGDGEGTLALKGTSLELKGTFAPIMRMSFLRPSAMKP